MQKANNTVQNVLPKKRLHCMDWSASNGFDRNATFLPAHLSDVD